MILRPPYTYLLIAALLLAIGIFGLLRRRTLIGMLNLRRNSSSSAASLNLMTFNRFKAPDPAVGPNLVLFIMGLAAAEIAIALSIIVAVYRNYRSVRRRSCPNSWLVPWHLPKTIPPPAGHSRPAHRRWPGHGQWQAAPMFANPSLCSPPQPFCSSIFWMMSDVLHGVRLHFHCLFALAGLSNLAACGDALFDGLCPRGVIPLGRYRFTQPVTCAAWKSMPRRAHNLFRPGPVRCDGRRFLRQPANALFILRNRQHLQPTRWFAHHQDAEGYEGGKSTLII